MIKREASIFLIVGLLTVGIDFLTYRGLVDFQITNIAYAKGIGFLTGTIFAYFANRFWTFGHTNHSSKSIWRFIIIYTITLTTNILVNSFLIAWLPSQTKTLWDALLIATNYLEAHSPVLHNVNLIFNQLPIVSVNMPLAFLIATVTSATMNFFGMKFFVFTATSNLK